LFVPEAIAVVGASASGSGLANNFIRNLKSAGYASRIFPIHPSAKEVEGLPAYRSFAELPQTADYAYISVAADRVPALFETAHGKVRFAQVISSGFAEIGETALEQRVVAACHAAGARLLGPNCLGIYSAAGRISFIDRVLMEPGSVGVLSQSGGLGVDILRRGQVRGLRLNSLVTLGNSADLTPVDVLRHLLADDAVKVIGLYLEDIKDGRAFFDLLRSQRAPKPIVILKGGRTAAGQRASASHTGALAQDDRLWVALSKQTGAVLVETLDAFLDALIAFQMLTPRISSPTRNVAIFGNGGGTSVLASDAFSRCGLNVPQLAKPALDRLYALALPPGSSVENPVDTPAGTLRQENGAIAAKILECIYEDRDINAIVMHINMPVILSFSNDPILPNLVKAALDVQTKWPGAKHFMLVLRSDGEIDIETERLRYRALAHQLGMPVFGELIDAAKALACVAWYETFLARHGSRGPNNAEAP
jgi:acyl-CoA synthetase (NDP forming)